MKLIPARFGPLARYLRLQCRFAVMGLKEKLGGGTADSLPLPSPRLRHRVHGSVEADSFVTVGARMKGRLCEALEPTGRTLSSFEHILDFGCGSGRLLRHLQEEAQQAKITGCDIDGVAVRWCQQNLPYVDAVHTQPMPPLPFDDGTFDLVISISIFTHLDEEYQNAWLAELARVTKPGAILLLTVQCQRLGALNPQQKQVLDDHGFVYFATRTTERRVLGLPEFYQSARHSRAYIDRVWSQHFTIEQQCTGPNQGQDIIVCRKPS
ncbi:MAG: class I SAM-dependent methyltransferase [Planctomycetota bacterium]